MTTKLTLSIDESVAELAKRVAKSRNTSVSAMLSQFVLGLDAIDRPAGSVTIAPLTLAASGLARPPCNGRASPESDTAIDHRTDEKLLEDALWERYGPVE